MGARGKPAALALAVASAGVVYTGGAQAQDGAATLEEVIVNATRRDASVQNIPATELSNVNDDKSRKQPTSSRYTCSRASVECTRFAWVTGTPFGRPEVPDVYKL